MQEFDTQGHASCAEECDSSNQVRLATLTFVQQNSKDGQSLPGHWHPFSQEHDAACAVVLHVKDLKACAASGSASPSAFG